MKTTNNLKTLTRIGIQAIIGVIFIELFFIGLILLIKPDLTIEDCIYTKKIRSALTLLGYFGFCIILVFGAWFHFASEYRFKNRRPKGLYKEYIKWFLNE